MDSIFFTDTHAHIHDDEYGRTVEDFIALARENNVLRCITIGIDYENSLMALEAAKKHTGLYAAVGLHPEYADIYNKERDYEKFYNIAKHEKVLAVGETGLDFYYENNPEKEKQVQVFEDMVDIACKINKPIVIHSRNAADDTIEVLEKAEKKYHNLKGIFHCFDGSLQVLDWVKNRNFYISYAGNVTFKNAENLRIALENTKIDKLLIETDSPYLSPVPVRGKKNMPANVLHTARFIADYLKIDISKLSYQLEENFKRLMGEQSLWK